MPVPSKKDRLSALKKKRRRVFVELVKAEKLTPAQALERASFFPIGVPSKVIHWPKL